MQCASPGLSKRLKGNVLVHRCTLCIIMAYAAHVMYSGIFLLVQKLWWKGSKTSCYCYVYVCVLGSKLWWSFGGKHWSRPNRSPVRDSLSDQTASQHQATCESKTAGQVSGLHSTEAQKDKLGGKALRGTTYCPTSAHLQFIHVQVVVESYNELQDSLSEVERMLFQHKLQEAEKVTYACRYFMMSNPQKQWISTCSFDTCSY